jgi:hypothetical protein
MALKSDVLGQQFARLGDAADPNYTGSGTLLQAPGRLASAYDAYAKSAVDAGGNALVAGNVAAMQASLASVFAVPAQSAAAAAQGIGLAHTAYWMGAVFATGAPPTRPGVGGTGIFSVSLSSVVVAAPAVALVAALTQLFARPSSDAQARAQEIAQAWHGATVTVAFTTTGLDTTPPPAGPLPVVLQGTVA